ncbi:MAG: DinB family protein [Spirosomataceae bacterium]
MSKNRQVCRYFSFSFPNTGKENLLRSPDYEEWANAVILCRLQQCRETDERALQVFAHVLAPQTIWLSRIRREVPTVSLWPALSLDECAALMKKNLAQWRDFIATASEEDLKQWVSFKLPNADKEQKIAVYDVVAHLINHGTNHHGQIILRLKGKIHPLPLTTYITFAASF